MIHLCSPGEGISRRTPEPQPPPPKPLKDSVISIHLEKETPQLWPFVIRGPDESGACDAHSVYNLALISERGMAREPMPGQEGAHAIIPPNEEQSLVYYKQAAGAGHAGGIH